MSCPSVDERDPAHVATCAACRHAQALTEALGAVPLPPADERFVRSIGERLRAPPPRSRRLWVGVGLSLSGAVAAALVVALPAAELSEPVARGGAAATSEVAAFRAWIHTRPGAPASEPLQAGSRIGPGAGLSFEVTNRSGSDTRFMLFGVDARRDVHWFYPAWDGNGAPTNMPLPASPARLRLAEGVTPEELARGALLVVGLFLPDVLTVQDVEALVARGGLEEVRRRHPAAALQLIEAVAE